MNNPTSLQSSQSGGTWAHSSLHGSSQYSLIDLRAWQVDGSQSGLNGMSTEINGRDPGELATEGTDGGSLSGDDVDRTTKELAARGECAEGLVEHGRKRGSFFLKFYFCLKKGDFFYF